MTTAEWVHVGEVGQKLTVTGTVRAAKHLRITLNDRGYSHDTTPVLLVIEAGNALVKTLTFAAWARDVARGDEITVTGVVKEHRAWYGTPQTVLRRPKRVDQPGQAPMVDRPPDAVWEAVNPARSGPRPFPGQTDPLAAQDEEVWEVIWEGQQL